MKIYTKTGDKGKTSLIGGARIEKDDIRLEAYGTIDELNSFVGLLVSVLEQSEEKMFLEKIQTVLFDAGSMLALEDVSLAPKYNLSFDKSNVAQIEQEIDRLDKSLEPLKSFVIPGGTVASSLCHVCRTVTRRAERILCTLNKHLQQDENVLMYINRLSDYFFVLARYLSVQEGKEKYYLIR